ncbi:SAM-dependent methyltransferase [Phycicoccus sonneratiae]|uniref:SAM-dependent methyltransferase n=1 Tax=Phycicoccus sonneratiae TaxID=2807628 RepID=A0ABS2CJA8_9MICO|nr:SAM-dependent methyltransferase [Phycicoccus sonneraticus]MBM6399962.1 SAM-dependent methyltransferase [Phycicoccus sonneraticus]
MDPVPWRDAWQQALYGTDGFYRRDEGPAGHFTTSTHGPLGAVLAEALGRLADREGVTHVVDVGCGRGELLGALHAVRPDLALTGVDVVERPTALAAGIHWLRSPGGATLPDDLRDLDDVLVVAHEWLDVVPCTVVEVDGDGLPHEVLVDAAAGAEEATGPVTDEDAAWCAAHWPLDGLAPGSRVEVGLARDRAWGDLVSRVRHGTLLAVDYGHTRATRPPAGTLVGYRAGTTVPAVPDGTCDLTAHVAVDTLEQDERTTQRDALRALGLTAAAPDIDLARTDPPAYLAGLARASAVRALTDPDGLGGFWWVLRRVATG